MLPTWLPVTLSCKAFGVRDVQVVKPSFGAERFVMTQRRRLETLVPDGMRIMPDSERLEMLSMP